MLLFVNHASLVSIPVHILFIMLACLLNDSIETHLSQESHKLNPQKQMKQMSAMASAVMATMSRKRKPSVLTKRTTRVDSATNEAEMQAISAISIGGSGIAGATTEEVEKLRHEAETRRRDLEESERKNQNTIAELKKAAEAERQRMREQQDSLREKLRTATRRRAEAQGAHAQANAQIEELSAQLTNVAAERVSAQNETEKLRQLVESASMEAEKANIATAEALSRVETMESDVEEARKRATSADDRATMLDADLCAIRKECANLQAKLEAASKHDKIREMEWRIATRRKDNGLRDLRKQAKKTKDELMRTHRDHQAVVKKLSEVQERLIELETQHSESGKTAHSKLPGSNSPDKQQRRDAGYSGKLRSQTSVPSSDRQDTDTKDHNSCGQEAKKLDVTRLLATRLEGLLEDNGKLKEKVAMLESIVQRLTDDLENAKSTNAKQSRGIQDEYLEGPDQGDSI